MGVAVRVIAVGTRGNCRDGQAAANRITLGGGLAGPGQASGGEGWAGDPSSPTSHVRSWASSLMPTNWTNPQLP
ncbi:hypothetical protein RKD20_009530 [Streptomyces sp. SLBN-8D4]